MKQNTAPSRLLCALKQCLHTVCKSANTLYIKFQQCTEHRPLLTPVTLALSLNLIIEMLGRRSVADGLAHLLLHPYIFFINALILFVTLLPAFLFSRRAFVYICITAGWLILGITNCILLGMRNTPLAAIDFGLITSCFGIIDVYLNLFQILLIVVGILLLLLGLYRLFRRTNRLPMNPLTQIRRICAVIFIPMIIAFVLRKLPFLRNCGWFFVVNPAKCCLKDSSFCIMIILPYSHRSCQHISPSI